MSKLHGFVRRRDRLYQHSRAREGRTPGGTIINFDRDWDDVDSSTIYVRFDGTKNGTTKIKGHYVLALDGDIFWNALNPFFDPSGKWDYVWVGDEESHPGGDIQTFTFNDLDGNWDSGSQRWEIE